MTFRSEVRMAKGFKKSTICWDCERAAEKTCPWSQDFKPIEGWQAEAKVIKGTNSTPDMVSYRVDYCPLFVRDSWGGGQAKPGTEEAKKYEITVQGL